MNSQDKFLTTKQVSAYLGIPLRTVYHLTKQGKIKSIRVGCKIRYLKEDVEKYLAFGTNFSKEPIRIPDNFVERRAYPRINSNSKCQYSINLFPFRNINSMGIVKNLSAGGILFINLDENLSEIILGDPIILEFKLSSEDINIKTEGRIIRKDNSGISIKFRNMDENMKNKIVKYIG